MSLKPEITAEDFLNIAKKENLHLEEYKSDIEQAKQGYIAAVKSGNDDQKKKFGDKYEEIKKNLIKEEQAIKDRLRDKLKINEDGFNITKVFEYGISDSFENDVNNKIHEFTKYIEQSIAKRDIIAIKQITNGERAYATKNINAIALSEGEETKSIFHELGHWLEQNNDDILDKSIELLQNRTIGEKARWLGPPYSQDEVSKIDKFIHPYMGKIYKHNATEIISMGFQYLYDDPLGLAINDPDYFSMIFNLARGKFQ